jgi:CspA family cold shock protein
MLSLEDVEPGSLVTHRNTGLRYTMVDAGEDEVLLSPEASGMQDLVVPVKLFREEFVASDRYNTGRGRAKKSSRGRRSGAQSALPTGPKVKGKVKKLVRERGFGFVRGDDGREVFFHRSGLGPSDYDSLSEGDVVEYVVQEGPRGARAENVRAISEGE